jgi:amino acid transporter
MKTTTLLASAVAGMVGSGWLLGPLVCARIAGPAAILSWPIAGLMMFFIAATFVLITRLKPLSGGTAQFFQLTYGDFAGFGFAWISWLAWIAVAPIETMALIQYSANYIPSLMTKGTQPVLTQLGMFAAIVCLLFISVINTQGIKLYNRINHVILVFKLMVPMLIVAVLLCTHFSIHNFQAHGGFLTMQWHSVFAALPMAGVIYSFIGFNPVIQCAAESKNPRVAIPIAIFGALFICILLYTLIQAAFIGALPAFSIENGWSQIQFPGDNGPFAGLLTLFGLMFLVKIIYLDATLSPFGTAMVQSMATSRLTYGMSQCGYFPKYFQGLHHQKTPRRAVILNTLLGLIFFLPFPSWQHMVGFLVSCLVLGYVIGPMTLMVMAVRNPTDFKMHNGLIHLLAIIAFVVCNLMIYWSGFAVVSKIMVLFVLGYCLLFLNYLIAKTTRKDYYLHVLRGSWVIFYLMGLFAISYFGSFGGNHVLTTGIDAIVIAGFSICIYALAYIVLRNTPDVTITSPAQTTML